MKKYSSHTAVSLIEVMVAIIIFFLGLVSVYSVISSTMRINEYNKNYIIASNLARESYEIINNIRDYNFKNIRGWDTISEDNLNKWEIGKSYIVGNNISNSQFLDTQIEVIDDFKIGEEYLSSQMQNYRLCLDEENTYSYDCTGNKQTPFYRYIQVDRVNYIDDTGNNKVIEDALKFTSGVVWYMGGYYETEISFILTDWQRL